MISDGATESFDPEDQRKVEAGIAAGNAFGKGRVAVFGEAAMFSAQVPLLTVSLFESELNVPGNDDRQFALNVMHWLAHLID